MKKIIIGILSGIASSLISKGGETFPWGGFLILWAVLFVMITLLWNKIVEHKITAVLSAIAAICLSISDNICNVKPPRNSPIWERFFYIYTLLRNKYSASKLDNNEAS